MQAPAADVPRFSPLQRAVHRVTAALVGICAGTGIALYVGPLSVAIGRRALLEQVHVVAGILLPLPLLVGWCSRHFRADARRLNRFAPQDWQWLRSTDRRSGRIPVGKFNAGQKLNAAFTLGAILVLFGTGTIMRFANAWPVRLRTGATFVHDWLSVTFLVVICGHLWFAWRDPVARSGMRTGQVPRTWAAVEHGGWLAEMTTDQPPATEGRTWTSDPAGTGVSNPDAPRTSTPFT